jgi:hypothetical protein
MIEPANIESLKAAVEGMQGGTATFVQTAPVREEFEGAPVWEGVVHVFELVGNESASRAYAWPSPVTGSEKRRLFAVPMFRRSSRHWPRYERPSWRNTERNSLLGRGATG